MNYFGLLFFTGLLFTVKLNVFSWAATTFNKTTVENYDGSGHPDQQAETRMLQQCDLKDFSLGGQKPIFPEVPGVTFFICQDHHYATFYNNVWGIARYAVYKITAEQAKAGRVKRFGYKWQKTEMTGLDIHQGSGALYRKQPTRFKYDRGHIVPFGIFAYSKVSAKATFTYTNCVPQNANFNRGQWRKYEEKIDSYSFHGCSKEGDTLYLITGISKVQFQEDITGVDKSVQEMEWFHSKEPDPGKKIAIPNSMWTVGCCLNADQKVKGAFGVMGTNSENKPLNEFMMSTQSVKDVEDILQLENVKIKLFHNNDCYAPGNNVQLINVPSL